MILSWLCVNIIVSVMIPPGYQCAEISCVSIAGIVNKSSDHGCSVNDAELQRRTFSPWKVLNLKLNLSSFIDDCR